MFAVVYIPDFLIQAVTRHEPKWRSLPLALSEQTGSKPLICAVNAAARRAEVRPGLSPTQAVARCPKIVIQPRSNALEASAAQILLQLAYGFSPAIEETGPGICTLDMQGLSVAAARWDRAQGPDLFGWVPATPSPRRPWARKIIAEFQAAGLEARVGVAATPELAWHAADAAESFLEVIDPSELFEHRGVETLGPPPELLEILRKWGIRSAAQFLALNREGLAERLGPEALALYERVSSTRIRPLRLMQPSDVFEEGMEFQDEIQTLEPLLFSLKRFIEQLARRVQLVYKVVAEIEFTLTLASGGKHERLFRVPAPTANPETLFRMVHTHLENLRTESPVTAMRVAARPGRAEHRQFNLFAGSIQDPNHFAETLARLTALLGTERVGTPVRRASHRPDDFTMSPVDLNGGRDLTWQTARKEREAGGSRPNDNQRFGPALRRFRPASAITVSLQDEKPVAFQGGAARERISRVYGPWRSSGTWWENGWRRDEWDVETVSGKIYRIYQDATGWFLEGLFD
jgi:protein ImuB